MQEWLIQLITIHPYFVYAFVVVFACAEGPILSMVFGVLLKLGYVHFIPIYAALMIGDIIGDTAWYYVGYHFGHGFVRRFGKYVSVTEETIAKVTRVFHRYKHRILFISKISNGFGFSLATLITAGIAKIPFWKYLATNTLGQFIWTGILMSIGYYFSAAYIQVDTWFSRVGIVAVFIVLVFVFIGYSKYLRTRFGKI